MPPIPAPAASAPNTSNLSGGGWYSASDAGAPTSSTSGTTDGVFAQYSQTARIDYAFNPGYIAKDPLVYNLAIASGTANVTRSNWLLK